MMSQIPELLGADLTLVHAGVFRSKVSDDEVPLGGTRGMLRFDARVLDE